MSTTPIIGENIDGKWVGKKSSIGENIDGRWSGPSMGESVGGEIVY
ncbi:hypothetical protein [Francisella sp. SYW-9]|nr:hypothetical protein [Francisella sp. SYW-9]